MFFFVALFIEPFVSLGASGSITVRYFDRDSPAALHRDGDTLALMLLRSSSSSGCSSQGTA